MLTPTKNGLRWQVRVADADGTPRAEPLELVPVCLGCGYASGGGDTARGLITCHRNPVHATRSAIDFCGEFQPSAVTLVDALEPAPQPGAAETPQQLGDEPPTPGAVVLYLEAVAAAHTGKAAALASELAELMRGRDDIGRAVLNRLEKAAQRIMEGTAPALGMRELGELVEEVRGMLRERT